jgi:hypothetical protein
MCLHILLRIKVNYTIVLPKDLKEKMDEFPEINWSEVIRSSIKQKITDLTFLKQFTLNSEFTEELLTWVNKSMNYFFRNIKEQLNEVSDRC